MKKVWKSLVIITGCCCLCMGTAAFGQSLDDMRDLAYDEGFGDVPEMAAPQPLAKARDCDSNADCSARTYCAKAAGDCDGVGECVRPPRYCLDVWIPVCGCDGNTYSNSCYAAAAGVNVDYQGECFSSGCTSNLQCGLNEYCAKDAGDCGGFGDCEVRPDACFDVYDPVCGCDGVTYSNACYAAAAGVNVDYAGECEFAGCTSNADCFSFEGSIFGSFCRKDIGDCDGVGECSPRPEICLDVWIPVCGCDGNVYSNTCYANRVGVNVLSEGYCPF